jgi:hypothetical protein
MKGLTRCSSIVGFCIAVACLSSFAAVPAVSPQSHDSATGAGSPSLDITSALWQAGGGMENFSMKAALVSMLGQRGADDEIARLEHRYDTGQVQKWLKGSDWLMHEGLTQLRNTGTDLPEPSSDLTGAKLAAALVDAGIAPGDTRFSTDFYYDHLFSHGVNKVMETEMDRKFSARYAKTVFTINDQAMYDVSQQIQTRSDTLAKLH